MSTIQTNKEHTSLLRYIILVIFMLIIYSNATVIRGYLIIMYPLLLVFIIADVALYKKKLHINFIDVLWYLIILYLLISLPFSYDFKESLIHIIYYTIMIVVMTLLKSSKDMQLRLIKIFYVSAILYAMITLSSFFIRGLIPDYFNFLFDSDRIHRIESEISRGAFSGLAGEVSYNMYTIAVGFGIVISNLLVSKRLSKFNTVLVIIMAVSLLLTQKRSVIVVIFLILLFILIVLKNNKAVTKRAFKLLLALVAIAIVVVIVFPDVLRVFNRFFVDDKLYLSGRNELWAYAKDMFLDRPLFGYGVGSYNIYCNNMGYFSGALHAHNIYIQMLAETGIVGFMLFMVAFISSLLKTVEITRKTMMTSNNSTLKVIILFSLYMQLFFLLYGFVGIPLYNFTQLLVYLISVSIIHYVKIGINADSCSLRKVKV